MVRYRELKEIINSLPKTLEALSSPDPKERKGAWEKVKVLVDTGNTDVLMRHRGYLRSLLWHRLQGVRDEAWANLEVMRELGVEGVERALTADKDTIKWSAWSNFEKLLALGYISFSDLREQRNSYWRLLKSRWVTVRKKAWRLFVKLVDYNVFDEGDKERFREFLVHRKPGIRIYAWETVPALLEKGFLSREEVEELLPYLRELTAKESSVKKRAMRVLRKLGQ